MRQARLMGTRFIASKEALVPGSAKKILLKAKGDNTIRTNVFDFARGYQWPHPYTARALENKFTKRWHGIEDLEEKIAPVCSELLIPN